MSSLDAAAVTSVPAVDRWMRRGPVRSSSRSMVCELLRGMRVVGLRLKAGQRVPEHRNAIPVALIVTGGRVHFDDGVTSGEVGTGEMLLINPGERHTSRAEEPTSAYLVFAGLPGVRSRT